MTYALDKFGIELIAFQIIKWADRNGFDYGWSLFYNGQMVTRNESGFITTEDVCPLDYCEFFEDKFVMGMEYENEELCELFNNYVPSDVHIELEELLIDNGLSIQLCDENHAEFVWEGNMRKVEYMDYEKKKVHWLYSPSDPKNNRISNIMCAFRLIANRAGEGGNEITDEYIEFSYKGIQYHMCSPCYTEHSYSVAAPKVAKMLEDIGATDIEINYGHVEGE